MELKYPNQRKKLNTYPLIQSPHRGLSRARTKNGNQQMINAPVTMARVFAAFFSRFSSNDTCFFFSFSFSFFGFRFSLGVVRSALSSVWHPVLECLIGPFLQSSNDQYYKHWILLIVSFKIIFQTIPNNKVNWELLRCEFLTVACNYNLCLGQVYRAGVTWPPLSVEESSGDSWKNLKEG